MTTLKRKFILFMCLALSLVMMLSLFSCEDEQTPSSESASVGETSTDTEPDADNGNDSSTDTENTPPEASHKHVYGEFVTTKEPSCTEEGEKVKACSCGDKIIEKIEAKGHTEEVIQGKNPTCTEAGLTEGKKCSVCGNILVDQEKIDALGHHIGEKFACSRCDWIEANVIVLTVDISSSMGRMLGETSRFYALLSSIKDAMMQMEENTYLEIIAFDKEAHQILELQYIGDADVEELYSQIEYKMKHAYFAYYLNKDGTESDIIVSRYDGSNYTGQGYIIPDCQYNTYDEKTEEKIKAAGTGYFNAFTASSEAFSNVNALSKKLIFVSDGDPMDADSGYENLVAQMEKSDVAISTIGIGVSSSSTAFERLSDIALLGGGYAQRAEAEKNLQLALLDAVKNGRIVCEAPSYKPSKGLEYSFTNYGCTVVSVGVCTDTEILIPYKVNGLLVTKIEERAFQGCTSLTSVTIPNSMDSIGDRAFERCTSLASVTIGNSVTSIGNYAFLNCASLTSVTIPDSVTSIGEWAFESCTSLASVTIGNSVASIGSYAFGTCPLLTSVTIPNSVTSIGDYAFANCASLTSVTIGNSVTSIGSYAFRDCTSLVRANYLGTIEQWCNISFGDASANPLYYANNLYLNGTLVTDLVIPSTVTEIKDYAFYYCNSLTSITIPNSVKAIRYSAFYGCASLTSVTIPNSVTSIGDYAFYNCYKLVEVYNLSSLDVSSKFNYERVIHTSLDEPSILEAVNDYIFMTWKGKYYLMGYVGDETELTLPENYKGNNYIINDFAFYYRDDITKVTIPNGVTSIGNNAFLGCTSLASLTIGNSVASIGSYAFAGCTSLTSVTIGDSVTSIGNSAFDGCTSLTSVTIPNSVTTIGNSAFSSCTSLTSIIVDEGNTVYKSIDGNLYSKDGRVFVQYACGKTNTSFEIPSSVISIGNSAFEGCTTLTSVTIGDSVTMIGDDAFRYCTSLTSITIPNSVTLIESLAFLGCSSLTIYCEAESQPGGWSLSWNGNRPVVWDYCLHRQKQILPAVEPTCIKTGLSEGEKCADCGKILVEQETLPINDNHINIQIVPGYEATCTETGLTDGGRCFDCGVTTAKPTVIPAKGHTEQIVAGVDATCTKNGLTEGKKCSVCEEILVKQEIIPINDNHTEQITKGTDATCTGTGLTDGVKCSACGEIIIAQKVTPAKGHTEQIIPSVEATCAQTGLAEGVKCSVCDEILVKQEIIPVNDNHTGEQTVKGTDATCIETGLTDGVKCSACGATIIAQKIIPAKGHTEQIIPSVEATCTQTGLAEGVKCSVCDEILVKQEIIPVNDNHTGTQTVKGYEATCTETGLTDGTKCSACDAILVAQNEISALGHEWENSYECSHCKYSCATPSEGIKYSLSQDGTYYIVTNLGTCGDTNIVIPYTYEGLPVKAIDEWAFYGYSAIESIIIPSSVEIIGDYAFYGCTSLTIYCVAKNQPNGWTSSWNNSNRPVYWYSETEQTTGNYWHYGNNGEIVVW